MGGQTNDDSRIKTRHSKSLDQLLRTTVMETPMLSFPLSFSRTFEPNNNNGPDEKSLQLKSLSQKRPDIVQSNEIMTLPRRTKDSMKPPEFRVQLSGYASLPLRKGNKRVTRTMSRTERKSKIASNKSHSPSSDDESIVSRLETSTSVPMKLGILNTSPTTVKYTNSAISIPDVIKEKSISSIANNSESMPDLAENSVIRFSSVSDSDITSEQSGWVSSRRSSLSSLSGDITPKGKAYLLKLVT